jgi:RsiW-degrading membrane proteinase PrsW (M82 family)
LSANLHVDRLLLGSPLRRTLPCVIASVLLVWLVWFAMESFLAVAIHLAGEARGVFLRALAAGALLSIVPFAILWFLDRRERESPWLFALAFLWGAIIATGLALPLNNAIFVEIARWLEQHPALKDMLGPDAVTIIGAPIAGPLVEEVTKGLGLVLLFWLLRAEFDNVRDGFVYGALIGLGFTWFETALYVTRGFVETGTAPFGLQLGWRYALFGLAGHAMFTGIFGAFLGVARQTHSALLKLAAPLMGLLLAIAAHWLNNVLPLVFAIAGARSGEKPPTMEEANAAAAGVGFLDAWIGGSLSALTLFLPFVVILAVTLLKSGRWERRIIREELADEIGIHVTPREYEAILADGVLRTRRIEGAAKKVSAALIEAQHELAFRKHHVKKDGADPELDALVAGWRKEIERLRATAHIEALGKARASV